MIAGVLAVAIAVLCALLVGAFLLAGMVMQDKVFTSFGYLFAAVAVGLMILAGVFVS